MFPTRSFVLALLSLLATLQVVSGNVEKEIFVAPSDLQDLLFNGTNSVQSTEFEALYPGLLGLDPSPRCEDKPCRNLRVTLDTSFLNSGVRHWVVLDRLEQGKRYEVRICWAATSPTDFTLNVYTQSQLLRQPSLLANMTAYATRPLPLDTVNEMSGVSAAPRSILYLEIQAKAGYYTHDKLRMENPDPVEVEIILDPFMLNVLPESLLQTAIMTIVVALSALWMSGKVYQALRTIASTEESQFDKKTR